jgi:hypothetical protein
MNDTLDSFRARPVAESGRRKHYVKQSDRAKPGGVGVSAIAIEDLTPSRDGTKAG